MLIRAKAPLRLSFAGGGTDVPPYPEFEGGCVLSATINLYAFGTLCARPDATIHLRSADLDLALDFADAGALTYDGRLDLVKAAIRRLGADAEAGFDLYLHTDAPPGSGLGSSSSLMVAAIGLLQEWRRIPLVEDELAQLAHRLERQELNIPGGMQDPYAAAFGGWNFIEFSRGGQVMVSPLRLPQDVLNELEHNLVLCYTGSPRASAGIIADQVDRFERREGPSLKALRRQKALAIEMKSLLLRRRLDEFGALMDEAWQTKKELSPHISSTHIDELYGSARRAGALGGKLNGAGGGGYMTFYCAFERRLEVIRTLKEHGCEVRDFAFEARGLQTWRVAAAAAATPLQPAALTCVG